MKTERTQIRFLSDVLVAVASLVLTSLLFSCDPTACFIMQSVVPFCRGEGRGGGRQINKADQSNADIKIGSIN